ncbi:TonB-dependent receptor [Roseateles amylovorans]|uniref:TonB-dependent receptor n=1 Tax=Roseateles amylovorans TaxID=2978473 RepID=A0ABY6B0T9_9BURK|nr:TonB-dependent receptor [Roseateles amylovorans]UXH78670.1 TonB-dependent receptor [Roseateles amylovorans]
MKLNQLARSLVVVGLGAHAAVWAQEEVQKMERVEITGSSIKRLKDEGALPVQVITASELSRKGITSAEQMLRQLGINGTGADNAISNNNVFGADTDRLTGGTANANLRGLGPGSTLVLLNGRRVSTSGMSGGAVDLNSIPMAAIQRVEILKDGASAIYGTDAIGGVINFILKKDYQGAALSMDYSTPFESGGGTQRKASITGGWGSLDRDGYNMMVSLSLTDNDILRGSDRDWAKGFQPARGLSPNSSSSPFANIISGTGTALGAGSAVAGSGDAVKYTRINLLSLQGACDAAPYGVQFQPGLWTPANASAATKAANNASGRYLCNTDYGSQFMLAAPKKAENLVTRGTFRINAQNEAFVELTASRNRVKSELTPGQFSTTAASGTLYPVSGPYYLNLKNFGVTDFDPTKPIAYRWRMQDFGNRVIENVDENSRLLVGLEGDIGAYSYKLGASIAGAKGYSNLIDGYAYTKPLVDALSKGLINPWVPPGQTQTPEAQALIESMKARGRLQGGETTLQQFDGSISGDLFKLPAGTLQFAAGFDVRRETYEFAPSADGFNCVSGLSTGATDVLLCPGNTAVPKESRNIGAVYGELAVPVFQGFDLQLAVRHDQYSKIGGTTNPKIGFRWQPAQMVLFRGSYNTGFKAPSFQQLSPNTAPRDYTATWSDPIRCPTDPTQCSIVGLDYTDSGNPNLKPEKSKQGTLGVVVSPTANMNLYADYWRVDLDQRIRKLTVGDVLNNYALFSDRIVRDANGNATLVQAGWINAADSSTSGIDWGASYQFKHSTGTWLATINGTHMLNAKERTFYGQRQVDQVGKFNTRTLYLRDKFNADLTWSRDNWSATFSTIYKAGYDDQDMSAKGVLPATANTKVASYTTFDLFGSYIGFKNTTVTVGIRNLFDRDPSFTHHDVDDVAGAGWDPRVADPFGRTLAVSVRYEFK